MIRAVTRRGPVYFLLRLRNTVRELGALGPLAAYTVLAPAAGAVVLVATARHWLPPLAELGPASAPLLFIGTVLLAGSGLIPTHASSLVAGMVLGATAGSLLALAATAGGGLLGHALVRRLVGRRAVERLAATPRAQAVHAELVDGRAARTAVLIALLRLSPAMPFAATNLLLGAAGVRTGAFLAGTLLGIAPRVVVVATAGASLSELDLGSAADARLFVLGVLATVAALVAIGLLARGALRRMTATPAEA